MTRFIYALSINDKTHYIGKTKSPKNRETKHKMKYPYSVFEIIDEVPTADWKFWERHYISLYRSWGFILDNKKLYAGNGCDVVSEITKKKMSDSNWSKGKNSEKIKKLLSKIKKGKKPSTSTLNASKLVTSFPVAQYSKSDNFIQNWESITNAGTCLKINRSNIAQVCKFKRKTAGNFKC